MLERLPWGKGWVTHAWGLEWTCVGIPRGSIFGLFWGVYEFNYVFMFNRGLSVFDEPIGVLLRVCCRIDVFLC